MAKTRSESPPAHREDRLDDWLDDALEHTFPASDPIATPPDGERAVESPAPPPPKVPSRSGH